MSAKKAAGKNGIFKFFGIKKPLFVMTGLEGDDIKRFVDREFLLKYFITSIEMKQNCAIIGEQGTGKSSFLLKLKKDMIKDSIYCDYLQFSFPLNEAEKSRLHFLRVILPSLLTLITANDELLTIFGAQEIAFEIARLEYSIVLENHETTRKIIQGELSAGTKESLIGKLIPADLKTRLAGTREKGKEEVETKDFTIHNENTLYSTIVKLLEKIEEPVVLFIDELDKVGRFPLEAPEWDKEVMKILELSRDIMINSKLILVFSLQNELYGKLKDARNNKGDVSILGLINTFKKLEGFDLELAGSAVTASLNHAGYKGGIEKLFEDGVIEIVLSLVAGNPRLFMFHLIEISKIAYFKGESKISKETLKEYLCEVIDNIDESNWDTLISKIKFSR